MKSLRILFTIAIAFLALHAAPGAEKKSSTNKRFASPDGRYSARLEASSDEDGLFDVQLIDAKSGDVVCKLSDVGRPWQDSVRLLWSPDSRRLAVVHRSRRGDWTDLFARKGETFEPIELPELPPMPERKGGGDAKVVEASYTAVRWVKPNVLVLDRFSEDDNGMQSKSRCTLTFDEKNNVTARAAK